MKAHQFVAFFTVGLSLLSSSAWSDPVDLSAPKSGVGTADLNGNLAIWHEIDGVGIQLGKGSYLPLRYEFSSEQNTGGALGPGFYCPMFEARNIRIREMMMKAYLPCGKWLYLRRDMVDPTKFQTVDHEWTGALSANNDFTIWRNDNWTIVYRQGRLTSIRSDDRHVFTWDYNGNISMATRISEDYQPIIAVESNKQGLLGSIVFNTKRYEFGYAKRPLMQMLQGQPVIKQLAIALSSVKYPDGKTETFQFALTPERVPTVTVTGLDKKQTLYTWDVATSHITTEKGPKGNWTYNVGGITQEYGLPPISRTSPDGKTEAIAVDNRKGTYTAEEGKDTTIVTHVFETPGPLYHKVKSIEKTTNGITTTIYQASYDEVGKLVRKVDSNGWVTTFQYDAKGQQIGQHVSLLSDPAFLKSLANREQVLLGKLKKMSPQSDRTAVLQDLYLFYMSTMDYDKATTLLPMMTNREQIYNLKLSLAADNPNLPKEERNKRLTTLLEEFPDKKNYTEIFMVKE